MVKRNISWYFPSSFTKHSDLAIIEYILYVKVDDSIDNCPNNSNPDQSDRDGDRISDACDNAPDVANPGQEDTDRDNVADVIDNCPQAANTDQKDSGRDGIGDACDSSPAPVHPGQPPREPPITPPRN
jgi:hypothetical protein